MFAKVYQYKFGTVSEAKVAASFCSDNLGKKISQFKFQALNVMIGKDGDLSIFIKFDTIERLKKYENASEEFIKEYINGEGGSIIMGDDSEVLVSRRKKEGLIKILMK